ncbi:MAG: acetyl-CoA carboxylase biotin carboxyl carrier protein subunit [Thermaerobacter sp.]|nr:acetyl-CoA carboxylase biotin carboxyl carrier protein subunit [Thermaerobacter sp.]
MEIQSPMAGMLLRFAVAVGDVVESGQEVAVLESMKMEVPVTASDGGRVASLCHEPGTFVQEGDALVILE